MRRTLDPGYRNISTPYRQREPVGCMTLKHFSRATAATAFVVVFLAGLAVPSARAAGSTLYVDNGNSSCSDANVGDATHPFCTIGKGASVSTAGQTVMLNRFLRDAGCQNIQHQVFAINWSAGTADHAAMVEDHLAILKLTQPFLLKLGLATEGETDRLYRETEIQMHLDDFCALWYLYTIWGKKPAG